MSRGYCKEPDVKYGRPKTEISVDRPEFFRTYDEEMVGMDARQFMRELVTRQGKCDWKEERDEWSQEPPYAHGVPLTDPDEISNFICRPSAVSQVASKDEIEHVLRLGMILIAVDLDTPNLEERLIAEARNIRAAHPLPLKKPRGRPANSKDAYAIYNEETVAQWREHRIIALHELQLRGYNLHDNRKQVARWMFPELNDQRKRGHKLDRAKELLNEVLAASRAIDAKTR